MTDRRDIQRARRYIVENGITREQFRANFNPQFVKNNEKKLDAQGSFLRAEHLQQIKQGTFSPAKAILGRSQKGVTKRVTIRHHYYLYNLKTHRLIGKWHGTNKRRGG